MMHLYSGTVCPFSHRCRIVLFEKGMDFEIHDIDLMNKPEDLAVMNPHNRVPVLVERDLILYEPNIINEYIDERFPLDKVLKKFKRLCDAYGIVQEYRARSEYKKPSVVKKEKLENGKRFAGEK